MAGRPRSVPAGPVTEHVRRLLAQNLTVTQIAREAGLEPSTIRRLAVGQKRVLRGTAQKVLGVPVGVRVSLGDVPAFGATRRVRALYALGHLNWQIAEVAGVSRDTVCALAAASWPTIKVAADDGIRAAYNELSMRTGTSWKTRRLAERNGWAPPLAWDDDTIDAPCAVPMTDAPAPAPADGPDAVARFLMGESVVLDAVGRREAIAHLMEWTSKTPEEIGEQLDMSADAVSRSWERTKRKACEEGRRVWRRVYVPQRELLRSEMESAA
jgi:DNA-binding CsgD family transcriptional regulator